MKYIFIAFFFLAGCAEVPEPVAETESPAAEKSYAIEIIHQVEFTPGEVFDFKDIPTRKLETPNGDVYIADHRQNPRYLELLQERLDYSERASGTKNRDTQIDYYNEIGKPLLRIKYIQTNDVMRAGCLEMVDSDCNLSSYYYKKSCGAAHNYGSNVLSDCERENYEWVSRRAIQNLQCMIDGEVHSIDAGLDLKTVPELAENDLKFECLRWRK